MTYVQCSEALHVGRVERADHELLGGPLSGRDRCVIHFKEGVDYSNGSGKIDGGGSML